MDILTGQFWRIGDFAKEIGRHVNTVDGWFKQLEEQQLHYVNRAGNEKVYDDLDLRIGMHIKERRQQKWSLDAIFAELPHVFDLRPIPPSQEQSMPPNLDLEVIRRQLLQEVNQAMATKIEEIKQHYEQQLEEYKKLLPKPVDPQEERQQRITEAITIERVKSKLQREALELWAAKPEHERMKKVGWFRKEENQEQRELFIRSYLDQHFAERLKKE